MPSPTDLLLVEPDPAEAELAVRLLRGRVAVARDGEEALRAVDALEPRVVLLCPRLPRIDGFGVLERLRGEPRHRMLPVVMLTSDPEPAAVARALALGANSVVRKPVRFEELRAALTEVEAYWLDRHVTA
ncbi:MAG TPA: response regulator [Gemmatimonadales bacterium]|nr:response regulator [Gemmatimonadales bacterium]